MNYKPSIAKVSLPLPIDKLFDYSIPEALVDKIKIGIRVKVYFNKKEAVGYVINLSSKSKIKKLNPIIEPIDKYPILTKINLELAKEIKNNYACSLGEAIESMIPYSMKSLKNTTLDLSTVIQLGNKKKRGKLIYIQNLSKENTLNCFKDKIAKRIAEKKKVILLVPEIKRIEDMDRYFRNIPNIKIAYWHSMLPKNNILNLYNDIVNDKVDLIIGTRSVIFTPLKNLDLIIVDEENNSSYKDDRVPYYHAVKIAQMRSNIEKCDVILSSVIPSISIYQLISSNKITFMGTKHPQLLSDIQFTGPNFGDKIDLMVEKEIAFALEKKEKILIFLNKKGFSSFIYCKKCKTALQCSRCSSNLRFDYSQKQLTCPSCSLKTDVVEICPNCNSTYVKYAGFGIEKLESNIKRYFPQAKIITLDQLLELAYKAEDYDIIIAAKAVLNLKDFKPDVTIVWNLENLLNVGDFSSAEDAYQLLSKLLLFTTKKMIISSSINPSFYLLKSIKQLNFKDFYSIELKSRKDLKLPPYYHIGLISIRSLNNKDVESVSNKLYCSFSKLGNKDIKISNPYSTLRKRLRGKYYKYLLIKSKKVKLLNQLIKKTIKKFRNNRIIITANIDPI